MIITDVPKENGAQIRAEDAKEKPFDPSSCQPVKITDEKGNEVTVPFREWLETLDINGRGGT